MSSTFAGERNFKNIQFCGNHLKLMGFVKVGRLLRKFGLIWAIGFSVKPNIKFVFQWSHFDKIKFFQD